MITPIPISAAVARRFLVHRHLLAPPRSLAAEPASVLRVIKRLGSLQFDPLEVPGARNHELVLHARVGGFERGWPDQFLYPARGGRRLIELYNKSLNILPIEELPYYRISWGRAASNYAAFLEEHRELATRIVEQVRRDGVLSTQAFRDVEHRIEWWWASTPAARAVMEALFVTGRLGIARRDGNRRYYDLIERLVPAELLATHAREDEQLRHRLLSRHRALGLMAVGGPSELVGGTGSAADRARLTAGLIDDGTLLPVAIEGIRETRHILTDEWPLLDTAAPATRSITFLAPLDPFLWDRRLLRTLFGFDYTWEVYTPAAKRRYGYYALPILFGERLEQHVIGNQRQRRRRRDAAAEQCQ